MSLKNLKIQIYADGAELKGMVDLAKEGLIKGLTTNPSLMRKVGISDYPAFAKEVLSQIRDLPISFEVFTDDFASMEKEAREISSWASNVYTKIPVTNTKGESALPLIKKLAAEGVKLNVTAILSLEQVKGVVDALAEGVPSIVSVFAGRIADTGRDPMPLMAEALKLCRAKKGCELLWASTRELLNLFQAESLGCDIITVPHDILKKGNLVGMDLTALSLDTVKMFAKDAAAAGYRIV